MALDTCSVTVTAKTPGGDPVVAKVRFTLNRTETDGELVVPESVYAETDETGVCVVDVWPNARGSGASRYTVEIGETIVYAFIPDLASVDLDDCLVNAESGSPTTGPVRAVAGVGPAANGDVALASVLSTAATTNVYGGTDRFIAMREGVPQQVSRASLQRSIRCVPDGMVSGNSAVDNSAAIKVVHDRLVAEGGGTVELPPGNFFIMPMMWWHPSVSLKGAGRNSTQLSLMTLTESAPVGADQGWAAIYILARAQGVPATTAWLPVFSDFHLTGRKGVQTITCNGIFAEIGNFDPDYGTWGGKAYGAFHIENMEIDAFSGVGIWARPDRQRAGIIGTRSLNNAGDGVRIEGNDPVVGPENGFGGNWGYGLHIKGCSGAIVIGNNIWGAPGYRSDNCLAVKLRNVNGCVIVSNKLNDCVWIDGGRTNEDRAIAVMGNYFNPLDAILTGPGTPGGTASADKNCFVCVQDYINVQLQGNTYSPTNQNGWAFEYLWTVVSAARVYLQESSTSDPGSPGEGIVTAKAWNSSNPVPLSVDGSSTAVYDFTDHYTGISYRSQRLALGLDVTESLGDVYDTVFAGDKPTEHRPHFSFGAAQAQKARIFRAMSEAGTGVVPANRARVFFNAASPIAAYTISLPAPVDDGHEVRLIFNQSVAAITWTFEGGYTLNSPITSASAGQVINLHSVSSQLKWYTV